MQNGIFLIFFISQVAFNMAVTNSILNLYSLKNSAFSIFLMMLIEGITPFILMVPVVFFFKKFLPKTILMFSSVLGLISSVIQVCFTSNLIYNFVAISFISICNSIQKPFMMEMGARFAESENERNKINNKIVLINFLSLLIGYLLAGYVSSRFDYRKGFLLILLTYASLVFLLLFTKFEKGLSVCRKNQDLLMSKRTRMDPDTVFGAVIFLNIAQWINGGAINVLEIKFAKIYLSANDFMVTLLFVSSACGSVFFSILNNRINISKNFQSLIKTTLLSAVIILLYIMTQNFRLSIIILFFFGFVAGFHSLLSMTMIQAGSTKDSLSKNTVLFNTVVQGTSLISAGLASLFSEVFGVRNTCFLFSFLAITLVLLFTKLKKSKLDLLSEKFIYFER